MSPRSNGAGLRIGHVLDSACTFLDDEVVAQSEERGPRIAAAVTGILSTAPLAVTLVAAMAAFHKPSDKAFGAALLVIGPVAVFATSVLVAVGRRWSGVLHLVALAVCGALGFFAAGLLALGGGKNDIGWFLLALLFGAVSFVLTVVLMIRAGGRRRPAR